MFWILETSKAQVLQKETDFFKKSLDQSRSGLFFQKKDLIP